MLLRGKYDALINVTWNCFDQSNFYISRINIIEWNNINIHLLSGNEGNSKFIVTRDLTIARVGVESDNKLTILPGSSQ